MMMMMAMVRGVALVVALAAGAKADDKEALLAFKASGEDPDGELSSWDEGTSPCGERGDRAMDDVSVGWVGVMCDASGGRVTFLRHERPCVWCGRSRTGGEVATCGEPAGGEERGGWVRRAGRTGRETR